MSEHRPRYGTWRMEDFAVSISHDQCRRLIIEIYLNQNYSSIYVTRPLNVRGRRGPALRAVMAIRRPWRGFLSRRFQSL